MMYNILIFMSSTLCFSIDFVSSASQPVFRKDYVFSPETQKFYKVHTNKVKFVDAVNRCKLEGATLLVIETKLERDVIINLVDGKYPKEPKALWPEHFIAVHDTFSEGEFVTLDGRSTDNIFMDWDLNEPDNNGNEDCVLLRRTGKMNDVNCDWRFRFICEKSLASVEWNNLCKLPDANYKFNKELGKCYKLHLKPKEWKEAYATCTAEQSYLAIINNQAEADYLVKIVSEVEKTGIRAPNYYAHAAYLGFHNQFLSGFITVNGQPLDELGYTRWAAGQPDNAGDERCGSMFFDGGLNDLTCGLSAIFICEHDVEGTTSSLDVTSPPVFKMDYVFSPETQKFYKVHTNKVKFVDAVNRCKSEGAALLVLETKQERDFIINLVDDKYPKDSKALWPEHFIAVHDSFSEGEFMTLDGRSTDTIFMDWDLNEPDNNGNEDCVLLRRTGKMNDVNCDTSFRFICEKSIDVPVSMDNSHAPAELQTQTHLDDQHDVRDVPFFRKDYEFNADTQTFYKMHNERRTWAEAKAKCELEWARLFIPTTKLDWDTGMKVIDAKIQNREWTWVGIHDLLSDREFVTTEGVPLENIYHEWAPNEPNSLNSNEHCVVIWNDVDKLNDDNCNNRHAFLCEKPKATIDWNILCGLPDHRYLYDRDQGKCYKLHLRPQNWMDAYRICLAEQSYLAIINSKSEADHIVRMVAEAPKENIRNYFKGLLHLGFHNRLGEGFTTIQGVRLEEAGYSAWGTGQPDNAGGDEKCGSMFFNGIYNDIQCSAVCIFMCEHDIDFHSSSLDERLSNNITSTA